MLEVEVSGLSLAPQAPTTAEIGRLCVQAAARLGVKDGHVAIEFVEEARIVQLNAEH
jgi:hypothetical protein